MTNQTDSQTRPPSTPQPLQRFFNWLRGLGIVRGDSWLGGVCGGLAARTGLDPLIVRGVFAVVAVLGGPAFIVYALGWVLLPDEHGVIHLEQAVHRVYEPVIVAIGVLVLISFLPVTRGAWWIGGHLAGAPWWLAGPGEVLRALWNLAIVAAIVWFVVWLLRRIASARSGRGGFTPSPVFTAPASRSPFTAAMSTAPTPTPDPATSSTSEETVEEADESAGAAAAGATADETSGSDAGGSDTGRWRAQYTAWREQHADWQDQQRAAQRQVRQQRSTELRAQSRDLAEQARRARALRKASRPRTSGWYVAVTLGVALVAGGIAAAVSTGGTLHGFEMPVGFAAALVVVGIAMAVAGAIRRRAGFLAAVAIALAVITIGGFSWPTSQPAFGYTNVDAARNGSYTQFAGKIDISVHADELQTGSVRRITVKQGAGDITVSLDRGVPARIEVRSNDSRIDALRVSASGQGSELPTRRLTGSGAEPETARYDNTAGKTPLVIITIEQGHGEIDVLDDAADQS